MFFSGLLQKDGWHENVEVSVDSEGLITAIEPAEPRDGDLAIPGFRNSHSHAFQYALAGVAENHKDPDDDFWSWRASMYELARAMSPEDLEAIAAMLYSEMVLNGYTHVAEFHYVHHDVDGKPYDNPAEMAFRLISAAEQAGINLTLVPVYYNCGGFRTPPTADQKRFLHEEAEGYLRLVELVAAEAVRHENVRTGFGVHSLRAATFEDVKEILSNGPPKIPFHIHISEQIKEVEECVAYCGQRPIEWMLDNIDLDSRFNLVHATHANVSELAGIARSGANVVLCPTTEANLGDGIFPFRQFKALGGSWSIGTDSHVGLNPFEEIRLLDYGQRLDSRSRNTFGTTGSRYAIQSAFDAGCSAMGDISDEFFRIGSSLNACVIKNDHPLIRESSAENRLNAIVYSGDSSIRSGSIVGGRATGQQRDGSGLIRRRFRETIQKIRNR